MLENQTGKSNQTKQNIDAIIFIAGIVIGLAVKVLFL